MCIRDRLKRIEGGPRRQLVSLAIDTKDAPAQPGASLRSNDRIIGTVTSGGWGHRVDMNLAYAFVAPDFAAIDAEFTVDVLGAPVPAHAIKGGPYDPSYARMKS